MPIADYNVSASLNTLISGIYIGPDAPRANVDNAIRQLMADLASGLADLSVNPRTFGAVFDGVTNDTAAWQAAIDFAALNNLPVKVQGGGTTRLVCLPVSTGLYGPDSSGTQVYRAVNINYSDLKIDLGGCTIRMTGIEPGVGNVHYCFATAKNMTIGALKNIRIFNGTIDLNQDDDLLTLNHRGFYFVGVDGLFLDDLRFTSSGLKTGAGISFQNSRRIRLSRLDFKNITQGANFSYVEDLTADQLSFDTFTEGIDFDHKATNFTLSNLTFRNSLSTDYQCMDFNSCQNGFVSGVTVYNVGSIAIVNYKTTTPPTFLEWVGWVSGVAVSAYVPSKRVTIEGVRGDIAGISGTNPFKIGPDQTLADQSDSPCENITLRDIKLSNTVGIVWIELCVGFLLEDIYIQGLIAPSTSFGCIHVAADFSGYVPRGTLRNVHVVMGAGSLGSGVRIQRVGQVTLDGVPAV